MIGPLTNHSYLSTYNQRSVLHASMSMIGGFCCREAIQAFYEATLTTDSTSVVTRVWTAIGWVVFSATALVAGRVFALSLKSS